MPGTRMTDNQTRRDPSNREPIQSDKRRSSADEQPQTTHRPANARTDGTSGRAQRIAIHAHHVQAVAAHVGRVNNSANQAEASQRENNQALKNCNSKKILFISTLWSASLQPCLPKRNRKRAETSSFVKSLESAL